MREYAFVVRDTVAFPGTGKGKEFSYMLFQNYVLSEKPKVHLQLGVPKDCFLQSERSAKLYSKVSCRIQDLNRTLSLSMLNSFSAPLRSPRASNWSSSIAV